MNNDGLMRVCRGGSLFNVARYAGVAYRSWFYQSDRGDSLGFRLSRVIIPLQQLAEGIHEQR